MEEVPRVVLGLDGQDLAEEVMHFLDRSELVQVVGVAMDDRQLTEAIRQLEPDAVLASPDMLRSPALRLNGSAVLAVDTSESVRGLKAALSAGSKGFFVWPGERAELAHAAARVALHRAPVAIRSARIIAVCGSRGGSGATFLATHLASAFAIAGKGCVLVDMDPSFGEIGAALGVSHDDGPRTIEDLAPVIQELTVSHIDEVLWAHPRGFRVLLAPNGASTLVSAGHYTALLESLAGCCDVIVVHLPRALDEVARAGVSAADRILVVLTLDVLSFHGARRLLAAFGDDERFDFVVNKASRAEIVPADVERVFGRPAVAVIPEDRTVPVAQDRGRLLPPRGRTGRVMARLAAGLDVQRDE